MRPIDIIYYTLYGGVILAGVQALVQLGVPEWATQPAAVLGGCIVLVSIRLIGNWRARSENRVLKFTPEELLGNFKGQTELKIEALKKSYIGKTLKVTGKIEAINPSVTSLDFPFLRTTLVVLESSPVRCVFHGKSARRKLEDYELGQRVSISGRIVFIDDLIGMTKCTIEKLPESSPPSPTAVVVLPAPLWELLNEIGSNESMDFEGMVAGERGEDLKALRELRLISMTIGVSGGYPQYTDVHLTAAGRALLGIDPC